MMTNQQPYSELIGKTKEEISKIWVNNELNYYPASAWTYTLKTNWLGKKTLLTIYFENDIVVQTEIKKSF